MLERDAPYVQIIEHYRQEIAAGRLRDGDMLPSGREIAAEFGVSLATAAKVASGLQALGLVTPRPGAGTWSPRPGRPPTARRAARSVITLAARGPAQPGDDARVLEAGLVQAPREIAGAARRRAAGAGDPPPPGHHAGRRDRRRAHVLVPRLARGNGPGPARRLAARRDHRLPAGLGPGLGVGPAADHGRGPRVRHQARVAGRSSPTAAGSTPPTPSSSTPS